MHHVPEPKKVGHKINVSSHATMVAYGSIKGLLHFQDTLKEKGKDYYHQPPLNGLITNNLSVVGVLTL